MSTHKALHALLEDARFFASFLEHQAAPEGSIEPLIDRYLDFKATSANSLRIITDEKLARDEWALDAALDRLENELRSRLAGVLPLEVVRVTRFSQTHRKLYQYLWEHRGSSVTAARLRVLTGDQVHTERRLRELRDIGFQIAAVRRNGQNVYELAGEAFDLGVAVRRFVPEFVAAVRDWTPAQRKRLLDQLALD